MSLLLEFHYVLFNKVKWKFNVFQMFPSVLTFHCCIFDCVTLTAKYALFFNMQPLLESIKESNY